jgi:ribosomal protein S13
MAKELSEETSFNISLKTLAGIGFLMAAAISGWFVLQADIAEAKKLPLPADPEITRMEYDMKDQLIRQTIMSTQEDVTEIKTQMLRMEDKIDKLR